MNDKSSSQGYLYIATGTKHTQEAIQSARSLKNVNSHANITLITSEKIEDNCNCFDQIIFDPFKTNIQRVGFLYKVKNIYQHSPYEKTLFIDSDTYFYEGCADLFELLDYCDLALSIEPFPRPKDVHKPRISGKKLISFQIYNTGVIVYKKTPRNQQLFDRWKEIYSEKINNNTVGMESDQTSFAEAWLESDAKLAVIPREWNARTPYFVRFNEPIRLVHGRHQNYEQLKVKLETPSSYHHRMWNPYKQKCMVVKPLKDIVPFAKQLKAIVNRVTKKT